MNAVLNERGVPCSDHFKGNALARVHLRVVGRDWLDIVVPAILFLAEALDSACLLTNLGRQL